MSDPHFSGEPRFKETNPPTTIVPSYLKDSAPSAKIRNDQDLMNAMELCRMKIKELQEILEQESKILKQDVTGQCKAIIEAQNKLTSLVKPGLKGPEEGKASRSSKSTKSLPVAKYTKAVSGVGNLSLLKQCSSSRPSTEPRTDLQPSLKKNFKDFSYKNFNDAFVQRDHQGPQSYGSLDRSIMKKRNQTMAQSCGTSTSSTVCEKSEIKPDDFYRVGLPTISSFIPRFFSSAMQYSVDETPDDEMLTSLCPQKQFDAKSCLHKLRLSASHATLKCASSGGCEFSSGTHDGGEDPSFFKLAMPPASDFGIGAVSDDNELNKIKLPVRNLQKASTSKSEQQVEGRSTNETVKPYELSDFYKYSEKFRRGGEQESAGANVSTNREMKIQKARAPSPAPELPPRKPRVDQWDSNALKEHLKNICGGEDLLDWMYSDDPTYV